MNQLRTRRRLPAGLVALVALAGLLLGLVACGVSTNESPKPIDRENLPSELVEADSAPYESLPPNPDSVESVPIWFLVTDESNDTELRSVTRRVPRPATPAVRLETLISQGPTAAENQDGLSTAIPGDATITEPPDLVGSVLRVSLSDGFYDLRGESAREAFAQLVYTATEIPGVESVQFELRGEPVTVPDGEGESREGPRSREDYANLRAGGS